MEEQNMAETKIERECEERENNVRQKKKDKKEKIIKQKRK